MLNDPARVPWSRRVCFRCIVLFAALIGAPGSTAIADGGWEISVYYTAVESYHPGPLQAVSGCLVIACKHGTDAIGSYPQSFVAAVKEEGNGRITSGAHAGQYLNWSVGVGYWLDSQPRDDQGNVLRPYVSAAADSAIPFGTTFRVLDCGTDKGNHDPIDPAVCERLKAAGWVVQDRFDDPASGKHVDLYIGEEDQQDFVATSPKMIDAGGAALSMGSPGGAASPSLTASPAQVPFGQNTTTIAFATNNGGAGIVCVAANGGAEAPFAGGASGSATAAFINSGSYAFTLHAGGACTGATLASATVAKLNPKGATGPAALASPASFSFATSSTQLVRSSTISFDTGDGSVGQVLLSVNGSPPQTFAAAQFGSSTAPWIFSGKYIFTLMKNGATVDTATVATTAQISSPSGTTAGGPSPNVATAVGKPVALTFDTGTGQAGALCTQFGGLVSFSQNGAGVATSVDTAGAVIYSLHVGTCAGALATPGTVTVTAT